MRLSDTKHGRESSASRFGGFFLLQYGVLCLVLSACSTGVVVPPYEAPPPKYAIPPAADGAFSEIEDYYRTEHGTDMSGFKLLDCNEGALRWRLALLDSARYSIDFQYYLWYGDTTGQLVAARLLDAADRGVKIRVLVDDLNTLLRDAASVALRDKAVAWLDLHPNVELRLFNPWTNREWGGRIQEGLGDFNKANQRMHNKALIVDNRAVIIGGRNIGDEYMGMNSSFNFHDLDVLGVGPVARQTSAVFDAYWNSPWVMPASVLNMRIAPEEQGRARTELSRHLSETKALTNFTIEPQFWGSAIAELRDQMHPGTSRVIADLPGEDSIEHVMLEEILSLISSPQRELSIINAYIIPTERGIATLQQLNAEGREVRILTNSLASHDVPAVNSHYRPWRKHIVDSGAELYELRSDAAIQAEFVDTYPTEGQFVGLHSKALVVDREISYIGSMNLDPRSAVLNTEMGVIIKSQNLGKALSDLIERDMLAENSWKVSRNQDGKLQWTHDSESTRIQPARNFWQRIQEFFFRAFPKEYY
ncbi:phospholipase D-like domain-containing protein [Pseudohalioglobus lutimaris]|uniref:phospholipase D-like domain-containing protein n=1 Tax=Pseudohalioglobus lutimaris TaxID=1737061 RepID=UPI00096B715D|nr:phospholipase D family protein [Pseudohalioglobus lutimaris]